MSSTSTLTTMLLYPAPPPTANKLSTQQRSRLMRSTTKLGMVLGTTPYILEASDLPMTLLPVGTGTRISTKANRRERSVYRHQSSSSSSSVSSLGSESISEAESRLSPSPASSLVSLPSSSGSSEALPLPHRGFSDSKPKTTKHTPQPLYIRLNPIFISPSDERFLSPISAPGSGSNSLPTTPTTATPQNSRHTYIFPPTPITPIFDQAQVRRKRMAKLTRYLGESIPQQLVFPSVALAPAPAPAVVSTMPERSASLDATRRTKRRSMSLSVSTSISAAAQPVFSQHKSSVSYCPTPKQREPSWIGEWNRDDMLEVQRKLRALR